jgi:hypothetical protein
VANALNMPPAERQLCQMPPSKRLRISDRYHGSERRCYHGAVLPSPVPSRAVSASDICEALVPCRIPACGGADR